MPRNNADRKRIALGEKHEVAYLRKLCRKFLATTMCDSTMKEAVKIKGVSRVITYHQLTYSPISAKSLQRVCKALLKVTK